MKKRKLLALINSFIFTFLTFSFAYAQEVLPHQVCQPNKYYCQENKITKCNEWGSGYITIEDCGKDFECAYDRLGRAYCKEIVINPILDFLSVYGFWLIIITGILVIGILAYKISQRAISKKVKKRIRKSRK